MGLACPYPIQLISTPILSCNNQSQARIFVLCETIFCPLPYLPFVMKASLGTFLLFYLPPYVHSRAAPSPTTKDLLLYPAMSPIFPPAHNAINSESSLILQQQR
ncbi:hypothetical protein ABVK25_007055 [Lepraria finkii]|uniref:Uncharacterized protein n=1 Tax=Lepraria finkii TaxID=1340010 RepID=A0ABR4B4M1_9LECA